MLCPPILLLLLWQLGTIHALSASTQSRTFVAHSIQSKHHDAISFTEIPIRSVTEERPMTRHDSSDATPTSIGERLKEGASLIEVHDLATPQECEFLVKACIQAAQEYHQKDDNHYPSRSLDKPGLVRIPTIAAAERAAVTKTPCADPLLEPIDQLLQKLLLRTAHYIDKELPSLSSILFGTVGGANNTIGETPSLVSLLVATSSATIAEPDSLKFSSREPAINIYTPGGEFLAHKDAQALTVLLPLSRPTTMAGKNDNTGETSAKEDTTTSSDPGFQGGGTAFWSQNARGHRVEAPSLVLKPPAGTALLFGGCVTHAGVAVGEGTRVVFVASFSRQNTNGNGGTTNVDNGAEQHRDIYGDSM